MSDWQSTYDRSIREEDERMDRAEADRSESEKFMDRISISPDFVVLPIAIVAAGIPALYRWLRARHRPPPG